MTSNDQATPMAAPEGADQEVADEALADAVFEPDEVVDPDVTQPMQAVTVEVADAEPDQPVLTDDAVVPAVDGEVEPASDEVPADSDAAPADEVAVDELPAEEAIDEIDASSADTSVSEVAADEVVEVAEPVEELEPVEVAAFVPEAPQATTVDLPVSPPTAPVIVVPPPPAPVAKSKFGLGAAAGLKDRLASQVQPVSPKPETTAAPAPVAATAKGPRKARLRLMQIDPWSVLKTSFLLSVALGVASIVAMGLLYTLLSLTGVFDSLNNAAAPILGSGQNFAIQDYVSISRVLGLTALAAVINSILVPAIATLAAYLYNLAATLVGGVEVTLAEDN